IPLVPLEELVGGVEVARGAGGARLRDPAPEPERDQQDGDRARRDRDRARVLARPLGDLAGQGDECVGLAQVLAPQPLGGFAHCGERSAGGRYILYLKSSGAIFSRISAQRSGETFERFCSLPSSPSCRKLDCSRTRFAT